MSIARASALRKSCACIARPEKVSRPGNSETYSTRLHVSQAEIARFNATSRSAGEKGTAQHLGSDVRD